MKKLYIILALVVVSILMVFAGDTIKILRVYHNGTFTAIPLANIDSIDHSRYDTNGTFQSNYTSSIIETLDSTYNIPINEIDSVTVTEAIIQESEKYVESIRTYIYAQGEMEIAFFQSNLMTWLENQEWVCKATINGFKDQIEVTLSNGTLLYIDFQDFSFFDEISENNETIRRNTKNGIDYYDVSYQKGEDTIDQDNILYIEGRAMPGNTGDDYLISEYKQIMKKKDSSPIDITINRVYCDKNFLNEIPSKYGMVLIAQTHGYKDGSFQVEDEEPSGVHRLIVYFKRSYIKFIDDFDNDWMSFMTKLNYYKVSSREFASKLSFNKKQIVYGNYCYSYRLMSHINNAVTFGYINESNHRINVQRLVNFVTNMFNGETYENSINTTPYPFSGASGGKTVPETNLPHSKLRYFSITTDSLTDDGEIVGRINGYDNLKKNLKWVVYVHDGSDEFKPSDEGVEEIQDVVEVKADGSFKVKSDVYYDNPWSSYIVAFKYNGKVYYGGQKYAGMCPNENHPHKRDLGLSVKWACCNVGATMPFEIGYFYQWGDNERFYEWSNKEYKYWKDNNHKECKFIGYNISGNPDHDGATHLWGKHWRMPTVEECEELLKNCVAVEYNEWYEVLGRIKGDYVFSNKNGNWMFLPYYWNSDGGYWTGNAVPENERKDMWQEIPNFAAYSLILNEPRQTGYIDYEYQPFIGQDKKVFMASIRPVYVEYADE